MNKFSIATLVLGLTISVANAEPKETPAQTEQKKLDARCYKKTVCEAKDAFSLADPVFYFDGTRCKAYLMRGCYEQPPFRTQEECQVTCYK